MVTLLVGAEETSFSVHMDMLCKVSHFFRSAFMGAGSYAETVDRSIRLPEEDSDTIDRMVQWLYFKKFPFDRKAILKTAKDAHQTYMQLVTLYVAADKYGIVRLKNDIIDRLFKINCRDDSHLPLDDVVAYVYSNTTAVSGLRRLFAALHVWRVKCRWFTNSEAQVFMRTIPDFAGDIIGAMALRIRRPKEDPFLQPSFSFHDIEIENSDQGSSESGGDSSDKSSSGDESPSTA